MLSPSDTAIVFVLALLLFGPEQLPKLARQLGEAMRHIQSTTNTFMMEMERSAYGPAAHVHAPAPLEVPPALEELPAPMDGPLEAQLPAPVEAPHHEAEATPD